MVIIGLCLYIERKSNTTKEEIILQLVLSLNRGNSGGAYDRVSFAIAQYERLVAAGVIKEDEQDE